MHILGCNTVYSERNKKTRKVITVISKCRDILSFDEAKCYCFDAKVTELCLQTIVVDMRFNIESYTIREKHSRLLSPSEISFCKNFKRLEKWNINFVLISVTVGCVTCFVECVTASHEPQCMLDMHSVKYGACALKKRFYGLIWACNITRIQRTI